MRDAIEQIVGKTISGVVVKKRDTFPRSQVFILFSDNTYYELYGEVIKGAGGIDRGGLEAVLKYMPEAEIEFQAPR